MLFLPPRRILTPVTRILRADSGAWVGRTGSFVKGSMAGKVGCLFCDDSRLAILKRARGAKLVAAAFPYLPEHALLVSGIHAPCFTDLTERQFSSFINN